ncbi:MAG: AMP-binding protein, partial [Burkholderiales bacterium]
FSSGSTGDPRGVLLTHANLLANSEAIRQAFEHDEESVGVSWLPHFHDMGLVGGVLQPLYAGFPVTLMASGDFVRRPLRWLSLVSELGATTSGGPSFAYAHCCRRIRPDEEAGLSLNRWRVAFCGAEPVDDQVLAAFARRFASAGFDPGCFVPCYGLAEASLLVTAHRRGAALHKRQASESDPAAGAGHARPVVGCGAAASGVRVAIFHPQRPEVLSDDHVGEVCVAGPSVSPGYWRDGAMIPGASVRHPVDGQSWLRTGDLGFLLDGTLYISGRLKDVIKIGGKTTHALDIEAAMQDCDSRLHGGASVAVQVWSPEGGELVLVQEMPRDGASPEGEPVSRKLYACVVERFGIRPAIVVVVRAGAVPRTTSGKVRRVACGQPLQVFPGKHVLESYPSKWSAP